MSYQKRFNLHWLEYGETPDWYHYEANMALISRAWPSVTFNLDGA